MKTLRMVLAGLITLAAVSTAVHLTADDRDRDRGNRLRTSLIGFNEVPVVSTGGSGRFKAKIADDGESIDYELSFGGLQGVVAQSHIHVAQKDVNGAIVLWLCQGTQRAPATVAALTPECPQEGTVSGTLTAANVVQPTPAPQQILAGELDEVIAAIRAGKAYANVHTDLSPGGEIRGQIDADDDDHGGHKGK
jgi:CHRD domain-containing protein